MPTELRQQRLADGDVLVYLGRTPAFLLGTVSLRPRLGLHLARLLVCRGPGLGGGVQLARTRAGLRRVLLLFLRGVEDLTRTLQFLLRSLPVTSRAPPLSARGLNIRNQ